MEAKKKQQQSQSSTSLNLEEEKQYRCPKCKDREFIFVIDQDGKEWAKDCECRKVRQHERRIANSHIAKTFRDKGFGNFKEITEKHSMLKKCVMDFFTEKKIQEHSILFTGQVGSGKTHLAMALTNNLLKQGKEVIYIDYRTFISKLKQSITDKEEYQKLINEVKNAEILFIDDLFKGKVTDADINAMFELVNHRYLSGGKLIVTSELSLENLKKVDEAIASRIVEMANGYVINMPGINYRLKK